MIVQHKGLVGAKVFYKWLHAGKIAYLVFGSVTQIPEGFFLVLTPLLSQGDIKVLIPYSFDCQ